MRMSRRFFVLLSALAVLMFAGQVAASLSTFELLQRADAPLFGKWHSDRGSGDHGRGHDSSNDLHCQAAHVSGCNSAAAIGRASGSPGFVIGAGQVDPIRDEFSQGVNPSPPRHPPKSL